VFNEVNFENTKSVISNPDYNGDEERKVMETRI